MDLVINGIIPAMVTPLDDKERINELMLRKLVNHLIEGGVHGIFATGSQGEFYALSPDEKQLIWGIVVEEVRGRVPVYAGTSAITTSQVIELNRLAEDVGINAVSILPSFYIHPSEKELRQHYYSIADSTRLPVLLYNNPGRTGVNLSPKLVIDLSKHPNIVGIKDSKGDLTQTFEIICGTDDQFAVLMGRDSLIYAGLLHGAVGAIAATANVVPTLVVEIYNAYLDGDIQRALLAQKKLLPLRLAFDLGTFPMVVKEALNLIGIYVGAARSPISYLQEAEKNELKTILQNLGLRIVT